MQDRLDYLKEIATQAKSNATERFVQIANSIKLEDTPYYFYDNLGSIFFFFTPIAILSLIFAILFYKAKADRFDNKKRKLIAALMQILLGLSIILPMSAVLFYTIAFGYRLPDVRRVDLYHQELYKALEKQQITSSELSFIMKCSEGSIRVNFKVDCISKYFNKQGDVK